MLKLINKSNSYIFDELPQDYEDEFSPTSGKKKNQDEKDVHRRRLAHSKCRLPLERKLLGSWFFLLWSLLMVIFRS